MSDKKRYCEFCHLIIAAGEEYINFRKYGTNGEMEDDYLVFHTRNWGDCWDKWLLKREAETFTFSTPYGAN